MIFLVILAGFGVAGLSLLIHAALFAPEGYEDEQGFHHSTQKRADAQAPAPIPLTAADIMFFGR